MLSPRPAKRRNGSTPVYVNVQLRGDNDINRAEREHMKFAMVVRSPTPSITTANCISGDVTHIRPQDVQEWAVASPSTVVHVTDPRPHATDPRADYGESRSMPSTGGTTPQTPCRPFPGPSVAPAMPDSISEETTRSGLNNGYLNLPLRLVNIQDTSSDSAPELPQANYLGHVQGVFFSVEGVLHIASGSDSGINSDCEKAIGSRVGPRPILFASARPDWCEVGTSSPLSVSFPEENRVTMDCQSCIVQYRKLAGWQLEFSLPGTRGKNRYEIETITPCFSTAGERIVLILSTDESRVLAVAKLNVVAPSPNSQVKVFVIPSSSGGSTKDTVRQMVRVLSNQAGSGPNPFLTCGSLYCLGGQEHEATDFAHGLLDFALDGVCGGLPPPLSLRHLLESLPNLQHVLETYHLANGSLQNLCQAVRRRCTQQSVVRDVEFLANYCVQGVANDTSLSESPVSADKQLNGGGSESSASDGEHPSTRHARSVSPIYAEVSGCRKNKAALSHEYAIPGKNIQPQDSGLQWPSKLDHLPEEVRMQILTQVRDGTITTFKAMEKARDYAYATTPKPASAPSSPALSNKRKKNYKNDKTPRSHSGGGIFDVFKKKPQTTANKKYASDSQSGVSSEIDLNLKHQSRQRKGKKIRTEEERQQIKRKLSASSGDTLAGETSSVGTAATVGTTSLTSASSDEKQVEDTSKKTDGNSDKTRRRISSDSGVADMTVSPSSPVHPSPPTSDRKFGDCLVEMKQKMHIKVSPLSCHQSPP